jgi:hypothetical protein
MTQGKVESKYGMRHRGPCLENLWNGKWKKNKRELVEGKNGDGQDLG